MELETLKDLEIEFYISADRFFLLNQISRPMSVGLLSLLIKQ